jgi:hypothetical protein
MEFDMSEKIESRPVSAIVGLIIAIIALVLSAVPIVNNFAFVLAVISLVFGIVAVRATKKRNKSGRKMAIAVIILSVLAGVIVLASQAFYADTIDKAVDQAQESIDTATGKKTDELLGKEVDVTIGTIEIVTEDFNTSSTLPVKVTNKNSQAKSYSIQIEAVDANGTRIDEDSIYVNSLGSNQSQDFKAFQFVSTDKYDALKSAQFKVVSVSQY